MSDVLILYTTPAEAAVRLTLDAGAVIDGVPTMAHGRDDAHALELPAQTTGGAALEITAPDKTPFTVRGLMIPPTAPSTEAHFQLDDVHLADVPAAPAPPDPMPTPPATDPEGIIHEVYATGLYNLGTHEGCGEFTEACCTALHERDSSMWGHIKKNPGQNQYNGHAVDAVMLLAGEGCGIFDIVLDSVSPNAAPAYNYKGEPEPELWYYDVPTGARGVPLTLHARPRAGGAGSGSDRV